MYDLHTETNTFIQVLKKAAIVLCSKSHNYYFQKLTIGDLFTHENLTNMIFLPYLYHIYSKCLRAKVYDFAEIFWGAKNQLS